MRNSSGQSSKNLQILNTISKTKKAEQSSFRIHFTLMNIIWRGKEVQKQQKLIEYVYSVVNSLCSVHIVQVASIIEDDVFDVSVGLANDIQAFHFLKKNPLIVLSDNTKDHEYHYSVVISRIFQSFINKMQKISRGLNIQISNKQGSNQNQLISQNNATQAICQYKTLDSKQIHESKQNFVSNFFNNEQQALRNDEEKQKQIFTNKIWAFGIPKQYNIPEIKESLANFKIKTHQCVWKSKDLMQYLEISLAQPVLKSTIYFLGFQIQGYPYVVIPSIQQNEILKQLARYTVQVITRPSVDDEQKFIKCMADIGGVCVMVRTPVKQKDDYRYVIVFNNVSNAQKACRAAKDIKQCVAERKQYQLKVGRVHKFYTFTALKNGLKL